MSAEIRGSNQLFWASVFQSIINQPTLQVIFINKFTNSISKLPSLSAPELRCDLMQGHRNKMQCKLTFSTFIYNTFNAIVWEKSMENCCFCSR